MLGVQRTRCVDTVAAALLSVAVMTWLVPPRMDMIRTDQGAMNNPPITEEDGTEYYLKYYLTSKHRRLKGVDRVYS
jgi:hypothetical protein